MHCAVDFLFHCGFNEQSRLAGILIQPQCAHCDLVGGLHPRKPIAHHIEAGRV
jgi:hypothetical protein